jgi:site-specific recombinase XerD
VHLEPEQTKLLGGLRPPGRLEEIAEKYVFATRNGKHIHTSGLWRVVHAAVVRAAIEHSKASPHWFRHAHASHALDAGAPPHLVQQTLGHASLTTTTRYAHVRPGESSSRYLKRK